MRKKDHKHETTSGLRPTDLGLDALFDCVRDATVVADVNTGHLVLWNPAAERMFGYSLTEALNQSIEILVPADLLEKHRHGRAHYRDSGHGQRIDSGEPFETMAIRKNGEAFPIELSLSPLDQVHVAGRFVMAIIRDITERKQLEFEIAQHSSALERANAELQQLDKMKDQFLSIVSHELRTPLNVILGFGANLEDGLLGPLTAVQQDGVRRIGMATQNLLNLVNDLLDMSQLEAGKFRMDRRSINLQEAASEVIASLRPLAEQKNIRLVNELSETLPLVFADEQRLTQVLLNLMNNSIKFTPSGGRIMVRAHAEGALLCCEVEDTGIGIASDDLPKLFKPFQQLAATSTRQTSGTGLGLSICKGLVEAHGGRIGVRSALGQGSTFWFCLPISHEPGAL